MDSQTQQLEQETTQIINQTEQEQPALDATVVVRRRTAQRPPKQGIQVRVRKVEDCIDALAEQVAGVRVELAQLNVQICYLTWKTVQEGEGEFPETWNELMSRTGSTSSLKVSRAVPEKEIAKAELLGDSFLEAAARAVSNDLKGPFEVKLNEDDYEPTEEIGRAHV